MRYKVIAFTKYWHKTSADCATKREAEKCAKKYKKEGYSNIEIEEIKEEAKEKFLAKEWDNSWRCSKLLKKGKMVIEKIEEVKEETKEKPKSKREQQ